VKGVGLVLRSINLHNFVFYRSVILAMAASHKSTLVDSYQKYVGMTYCCISFVYRKESLYYF
jgi:hypothetical protein